VHSLALAQCREFGPRNILKRGVAVFAVEIAPGIYEKVYGAGHWSVVGDGVHVQVIG